MAAESDFTVADVYQQAAMIGQDIEVIINDYGKEVIEEIMPKIVYVLEQLETLTEKQKIYAEEIEKLRIEKESLYIHTKRDEAIQRQLEEKLSYMESLVTEDKDGLRTKIKHLQHENDCLCEELDKTENEMMKLRTHGGHGKQRWYVWLVDLLLGGRIYFLKALPGDIEVMIRMKSTIDEQRDHIRQLNGEITNQKRDIEALQDNSTRMVNLNANLRRNVFLLQSRLKQYQSSSSLTEVDGLLENKEDSPTESVEHYVIDTQLSDIDEREGDISLSDELAGLEQTNESFDSKSLLSVSTQQSNNETSEDMDRPGTRGIKNPDRPRYTLKEMQDVLEEKNRYKISMLALEEELELYKKGGVRVSDDTLSINSEISPKKSHGVRNMLSKFLGK